jgi:hypothetical protein
MDMLILLGAMLPMPIIIIGTYLWVHHRRSRHDRGKRRKIQL